MLRLNKHISTIVRGISTKELVYTEYGDPSKVIKLVEREIGDLPTGHIHVKWLASPINPADINQIQGVYPVKPPFPAVGGNEACGEIVQVADGVQGWKVGQRVIPSRSGLGCWRTDSFHTPGELFPIESGLSLEHSATLQVNPPTAYRMLHDFVKLKPGDTVIQNGATSAVGRAAIQICKILGIKTVNIVRKKDDLQKTVDELTALGADLVITEEQLLREYKGKIRDVALALNCVGGRSTLFLANTLRHKGYMVTYGGMSKQPLQIPTGPFIFKDIVLTGFWMSRWYEIPENMQERHNMYSQLSKWIKEGKLEHPNFQRRSLDEHPEALETATNFIHKQLFIF
ncbi:unnamed protein product [Auanema sp. JU1783]|nr:unnamed protein product [Auanema sp. JU1783]